MINKKRLFRVTLSLLLINLILVVSILVAQFFPILDIFKPKNEYISEVAGTNNLPLFKPSLILTENDFRSNRVFNSEQSIQDYLDRVNSPLKNYIDNDRRASNWIWSASKGISSSKWNIKPNINPAVLLTFLEKEQSLLSMSNYDTQKDPENRIGFAMGYGCPDFADCDNQYKGLSNQLNWAAYQLEFNVWLSTSNQSDIYKVGNTITTLDNFDVFLSNNITASMYRYTPHVYFGNYNVWKIMTAYGWGENTQTYNINELDRVNIDNRKNLLIEQNTKKVTFEEVKQMLLNPPVIGQQSSQIELLQRFLRQEGYYSYPIITGFYGNITATALQNYIKERGTQNTTSTNDNCIILYQKDWQIGDYNDEVKQLQSCLKKENLFAWPSITGYFGNVTLDGLNIIRQKLNIKQNTTSSNNNSKIETDNTSCTNILSQNYSLGMQNSRVGELQKCLRDLGFFNHPHITGYFGPITQDALTKYRNSISSNNSNTAQNTTNTVNNIIDDCSILKLKPYKIGQSSEEIKQLQICLRQEGIFNFPTNTGFYGNITNNALATSLDKSNQNYTCEQLKVQPFTYNTTSNRIKQLQGCMRKDNVFNHPSDTGYFGPVTRDSLLKWRGFV